MSCSECEKYNLGQEGIAYYRWKNANIGLLGCPKHIKEIINFLNSVQRNMEKEK